jgi:sugar diacid utilization regulator
MSSPLRAAPPEIVRGPSRSVQLIAARLADQRDHVASRVVEVSRRDIVDYGTPSDPHLGDEMYTAATEHLDALVASLRTGEPVTEEHLGRVRELAARRAHQGVPLESFGRASRLWATICWETVLSVARVEVPDEREAALRIASAVFGLGDQISIVGTQAYLDEITDRGLLRRELLEALLTAKGDDDQTVRLARRLHLRLHDSYAVVVVRGEGIEIEEAREQSPAAQSRLDRLVEETRRAVRPETGAALTGMRNGDLVVLYPVSAAADLRLVTQDCQFLASALGAAVSIGMSGWHEGRDSVGIAYAEAKDAVAIAARTGITGRAVMLEDVLVDHMLASSRVARRILEDVLRPLAAYDASRRTALVQTLRAYLDARFNLTKAAEVLFVNPNTVVYRLRRIKELTGRDAHDLDDVVVLYMALKLGDLA